MNFGIYMPARVDAWPIVKKGEELGFNSAWLYDSQMIYADTFASLALCAEHTTKIKLGQGVTNPGSRIAPLMASALGTINQLAPGRAFLGIGVGRSTRLTLGLPPVRVEDFREYIRVVKALTRGELVEYTEGKRTQLIQMIHREGSIDGSFMNFRDPIPVVVASNGPRGQAVAGELGDGLVTEGLPQSKEAVDQMRKNMQVGADKVGRRAEDIPITAFGPIYVTERGEAFGSERMKRMVCGPMQSMIGWYSAGFRPGLTQASSARITDEDIPPPIRPLVQKYRQLKAGVKGPARLDGPAWYVTAHDGHAWRLHPELVPLVTDEVMQMRRAIIGTPDEVIRRIKELESWGVSQVCPMLADSVENIQYMVEKIGREVIQRY